MSTNGDNQWSEDDVIGVLINPVYTMGSKPNVTDEMWIEAQKKLIDEKGLDIHFPRLLGTIQETFSGMVE